MSVYLKKISKFYAHNLILNNIDLEIYDDELLCICGHSDSGKTTLLRLIAGLESPTSGSIYFDNIQVNDKPAKDRNVAMIFAKSPLNDNLTVFQNLAFGLKIRKFGVDEIDKKVIQIAGILKLTSHLNVKTKLLSAKDKFATQLGRALVREPKILLLDNPCDTLNKSDSLYCQDLIVNMQLLYKISFVYVTSDVKQAFNVAERILIINQGEIQQVDIAKNIYHNPNNTFVASLVGFPQINFFDAKLHLKDNELVCSFGTTYLALEDKLRHKLVFDSYIGKNVILGVRAEHLKCLQLDLVADKNCENTLSNLNCFFARVVTFENLEIGKLLYLKVEGQSNIIVVRTDRSVEKNDIICVEIDTKNVKLFDSVTQHSILTLPKLNIIDDVSVVIANSRYFLQFCGFEFELTQDVLSRVVDKEYLNQSLALGICPENLFLQRAQIDGEIACKIKVVVEYIDRYDNYLLLRCTIQGNSIWAKVEADFDIQMLSNLEAYFAINQIMLYSATNSDKILAKKPLCNFQYAIVGKTDKRLYKKIYKALVVDIDFLGSKTVVYFKVKNLQDLNSAIIEGVPSFGIGDNLWVAKK
ncbi:MAG: ABC transporter ATP-binding protein [Clostridiales bacterium]|jgi:multiple sugar transport system ATP-binding protein|nr:ABC transporter ATP-binding protein [Clostridiales bacterium]